MGEAGFAATVRRGGARAAGLAVFCSLLALPAAAQPVPFLPTATEACLAAAEDSGGREACIGRSADQCADTPDGSTTAGLGICFGTERDFWDVRLNQAYHTLLEIEKGNAAALAQSGSAAASPSEALQAMQRAWIAWRDAACAYEVSGWGGGTGGGPAGAECEMQVTGRQALSLEARIKRATGP